MRPRLSVIVPVHDPAYGGGLLHRAQLFLNAFIALARHYGLRCEIVVVEWNVAPGAPRFRELLSWPGPLGTVTLRFIEAPAATLETRFGPRQLPFVNSRARNVGIRRASGDYILVTGADVIPNTHLMRFLAGGQLCERTFYRIDRRDLSRVLPAWLPTMMQLALCNCQDVTVHAYYGSVREQRRWYPPERTRIEQRHRALRALYQRHEANPEYSVPENTLAPDRLVVPADGLHRNGSGDFFLMHRDRWHELRGFTELPTRGHSDSLMCWTAASAGLRQQVLCPPARLFHQLHDREAVSGWPVTDWRQWYQRYVECRTTGTALITNTEDWGMRGETLPETVYPAATPSGDRDRR